jgi:hypothetical protein
MELLARAGSRRTIDFISLVRPTSQAMASRSWLSSDWATIQFQMGPFIAATQDRLWRLRDDAGTHLAQAAPRRSDQFFLGKEEASLCTQRRIPKERHAAVRDDDIILTNSCH